MPPVLTILHPPFATPDELGAAVRDKLGASVDLRFAGYFETPAQRQAKASLQGPLESLRPLFAPTSAAVIEALGSAEILCAFDLPIDLARFAPKLRWVQSTGSGTDHLLPVLPPGVRLTTATGAAAPTIAEFTLGRILQVYKDFRGHDAQQQASEWRIRPTRTLAGKTIGIVGYGAIGQAIARRVAAFDTTIIALRQTAQPDASGIATRVDGREGLPRLLAEADIVVLAIPGTAGNVGLMGSAEFSAMKPGALFCNVARGNLVDEQALRAALTSGHLGAAILDVTGEEPLPQGHPFWGLANVYLSPHGSTAMDTYMQRVVDILCDNILREREGRPLRNLVRA